MANIKIKKLTFSKAKQLLMKKSKTKSHPEVYKVVEKIISSVKKSGNKALIKISNDIDKTEFKNVSSATFSKSDFKKNYEKLDPKTKKNLNFLKKRIINFHKQIKIYDHKITDNVFSFLGQIYRPIEKIGIYAPGGRAVYPSSNLMTALIAKLAGSKEINLFFPSSLIKAQELMLATAHIAGIRNAYNIGGAQAIAAMAYGTETISKSDKIFGPGNKYVAEAKRQVFGDVGIDSFAGPSEVLIISDKKDNFNKLAADLIAQAEHGDDSKCIFIQIGKMSSDDLFLSLNEQIALEPRKQTIKKSLERNGLFINVDTLSEAMQISNIVGPEHLQIVVKDFKESILKNLSAGAIFIGENNSAVLGDMQQDQAM